MSAVRTTQLLESARAGDRAAMTALVARFEVPLRTFLRRRLPADAVASGTIDDLFQETQLEALQSLPGFTYRHDGSYLAWLYAIARRCLAREYERSKRRPEPMPLSAPGTTTDRLLTQLVASEAGPAGQAERAQQLDLVGQALAELPAQRRDAIILCYFEGCSGTEAAQILGLSHDAFRACLSRARRQLAAALDVMLGVAPPPPG